MIWLLSAEGIPNGALEKLGEVIWVFPDPLKSPKGGLWDGAQFVANISKLGTCFVYFPNNHPQDDLAPLCRRHP